MKISWMREATANIVAACEFIYEANPSAADRQRALILGGINRLADLPEMGRAGRIAHTRELAVAGTSYVVVYRIRRRSICILSVLHKARRWPRSFKH
jgi:toxin ParE1/3/4